jgi:hypothetical protein
MYPAELTYPPFFLLREPAPSIILRLSEHFHNKLGTGDDHESNNFAGCAITWICDLDDSG